MDGKIGMFLCFFTNAKNGPFLAVRVCKPVLTVKSEKIKKSKMNPDFFSLSSFSSPSLAMPLTLDFEVEPPRCCMLYLLCRMMSP
jgi:hypothetical protein